MGTARGTYKRRRATSGSSAARWSVNELSRLQQLVRQHGRTWVQHAQDSTLARFSAQALRQQWVLIQQRGNAASRSGTAHRAGKVNMWQPAQKTKQTHADSYLAVVVREAQLAREPNERKPRAEAIGAKAAEGMEQLKLLRKVESEDASAVTSEVRLANWEQALDFERRKGDDAIREAPAAESVMASYVRLWRLAECAEGHATLLCEVQRAENLLCTRVRRSMPAGCSKAAVLQRVRCTQLTVQQRDSWGLVFYPSETLTTLTAGSHRRWYVGGGAAWAGGMLTADEAARMMGLKGGQAYAHGRKRAYDEAWRGVEREVKVARRWNVVADSIPLELAAPLTAAAMERVRAVRLRTRHSGRARAKGATAATRGSGPIRYASIGSGGCDAIFHALRDAAGVWGATHEWAAEWEEERRRAVEWATLTTRMHAQAISEAVFNEASVDVLGVTWSCKGVSTAPYLAWDQREGRAWQSVAEMVAAVEGYVTRGKPRVVLIEQSGGLATHHRTAHAWLNSRLQALPYTWETGVFEAADFGSVHSRQRVLWIGSRAA